MGKRQLQVFADAVTLSRAAAEYVAALAAEPRPSGQPFSLALCGGGTPQRLYRILAQMPYSTTLPWHDIHVFWGDERCVPPDQAESSYRLAHDLLLGHVPVPERHIYRIRGELGPDQAAADYALQLQDFAHRFGEIDQRWPVFDLVLLGLGEDGHTASLFPGPISDAEAEQPALAVTASYQGRPAQRVTLTPPVFNAARNIIFLVSGLGKAEALAATLKRSGDRARWPARRIRPEEGLVTWMADHDAVSRLDPDDDAWV
jgi:6-phosphogluconolactonase